MNLKITFYHIFTRLPDKALLDWYIIKAMNNIVGAKALEVTAMGGLTSNLHFLMASFYRPSKERFKILCEAKAFPSDQYALETQTKFHGYNPDEAIVEVQPRDGQNYIDEQDIFDAIEQHKDELALIMIGGVNYYSGQVMPMEKITSLGGHPTMKSAEVKEMNLHTVQQLLEESLSFEQKAIELYRKLAMMAAELGDIALEEMARTFVQNEVEHADEDRKMMRKPDTP